MIFLNANHRIPITGRQLGGSWEAVGRQLGSSGEAVGKCWKRQGILGRALNLLPQPYPDGTCASRERIPRAFWDLVQYFDSERIV